MNRLSLITVAFKCHNFLTVATKGLNIDMDIAVLRMNEEPIACKPRSFDPKYINSTVTYHSAIVFHRFNKLEWLNCHYLILIIIPYKHSSKLVSLWLNPCVALTHTQPFNYPRRCFHSCSGKQQHINDTRQISRMTPEALGITIEWRYQVRSNCLWQR